MDVLETINSNTSFDTELFGNNVIKLPRITPYIYNIKNFLNRRNHPKYHPDTAMYMSYWTKQEQECVFGYWGLDQKNRTNEDGYDPNLEGGWRWQSPPHVFGSRFFYMQDEDELSGSIITKLPDIRDIDWLLFYDFIVCWGFSGFELDDEKTCSIIVKKINKEQKLTPKERLLYNKLKKTKEIYKPGTTEFKEYIDPIEYLHGTFEKPMGKPFYSNPKEHYFLLSTRGFGKSYFEAQLISWFYNFHGKFDYNEYMSVINGPNICVGSYNSGKSGELLNKFEKAQDLLFDNFGNYESDDFFVPGFFHKEHAGTLDVGNQKNPYRHQYKIKKHGSIVKKGTKTAIIHNSYEKPAAFVSLRAVLMIEDEVGLNDKLLESQKYDNDVTQLKTRIGVNVKVGTGGDILKIVGCKTVFYNPKAYYYLSFKNVFELSGEIGRFIPAYYTNSAFRDENGNQDIYAAYEQEMHDRKEALDSGEMSVLEGLIINRPLVPSEMFMSPENKIFPVARLTEHKNKLEYKKIFEKTALVGKLVYTDASKTEVVFKSIDNKHHEVINSWSLKKYKNNLKGYVVIYEQPEDHISYENTGKYLYKIGYDPYKDDGGGSSLASIIVFKEQTLNNWNTGITESIVAEFFGRRDDVYDVHEIAIKLAIYYNTKIMAEPDLPGFKNYCRLKGRLNLLMLQPYRAMQGVIDKPTRKYKWGVKQSEPIIKEGINHINRWLLTERGIDKYNKIIYGLNNIRSLRILDELIHFKFNKRLNFDGISALIQIMYWRAEEEANVYDNKNVNDYNVELNSYFESLNSINEGSHGTLTELSNPFYTL